MIRMTYTQAAYFIIFISPIYLFGLMEVDDPFLTKCLLGLFVVSIFTGVLVLYTSGKNKRDAEKSRKAREAAAFESLLPKTRIETLDFADINSEFYILDKWDYVLSESPLNTQELLALWKEECLFLECEKLIISEKSLPKLKDLAKNMLSIGPLLSTGQYITARSRLDIMTKQCETMIGENNQSYKVKLSTDDLSEYKKFNRSALLLLCAIPRNS